VHALPGCLDTLTGAFGRRPLLGADQVAWLGVEPRVATQWEREQADRLGLHVTTSQALAADPAATALAALSQLPPGPLALHERIQEIQGVAELTVLAAAALGRRPSCELRRHDCVRSPRSSRMVRYTPSAPKGRPVVPPEPAPRAQPGDHPPDTPGGDGR